MSSSSNQFPNFEAMRETLNKELEGKKATLDKAFRDAFIDGEKQHRSQLVYAAIYARFDSIFSQIGVATTEGAVEETNDSLTKERIIEEFDELKANIPAWTALYIQENKEHIKTQPTLMKELGLTATGDLGFVSDVTTDLYENNLPYFSSNLYENLSDQKKAIFPAIIDAFREITLQRFFLKQDVAQKAVEDIQNTLNAPAIKSTYDELVKTIGDINRKLHTDYTHQLVTQAELTTMDKVRAATQNKDALLTALETKLEDTIKTIPDMVKKDLNNFKTSVNHLLAGRSDELNKRIKAYQDFYKNVEDQLTTASPKVVASYLVTLKKDYDSLKRDIDNFNLSKNNDKEKLLIALKSEISALSEKVYNPIDGLNDYTRNQIPALNEIRTQLSHLKTLSTSKDSLTSKLAVIIASLKKLTIKDTITASTTEMHAGYIQSVEEVKKLANSLETLCKKQSWWNNPLWDKAATIAKKELTPTRTQQNFGYQEQQDGETQQEKPLQEIHPEEKIKKLIATNADETTLEINERYISSLENHFTDLLKKLTTQIETAETTLTEYANTCETTLKKLEAQLFAYEIKSAQAAYKNDLIVLKNTLLTDEIKAVDTDTSSLKNPADLLELFNTEQTAKAKAIEKENAKAEEIRQTALKDKLAIKAILTRLHAVFSSFPEYESADAYSKLKSEYQQEEKQPLNPDNIARFRAYFTALEKSVNTKLLNDIQEIETNIIEKLATLEKEEQKGLKKIDKELPLHQRYINDLDLDKQLDKQIDVVISEKIEKAALKNQLAIMDIIGRLDLISRSLPEYRLVQEYKELKNNYNQEDNNEEGKLDSSMLAKYFNLFTIMENKVNTQLEEDIKNIEKNIQKKSVALSKKKKTNLLKKIDKTASPHTRYASDLALNTVIDAIIESKKDKIRNIISRLDLVFTGLPQYFSNKEYIKLINKWTNDKDAASLNKFYESFTAMEAKVNEKLKTDIVTIKKKINEKLASLSKEEQADLEDIDSDAIPCKLYAKYQTLNDQIDNIIQNRNLTAAQSDEEESLSPTETRFQRILQLDEKETPPISEKRLSLRGLPQLNATSSVANAQPKKENNGFWARHGKAIVNTTAGLAVAGFFVGAAAGAGVGAAVGMLAGAAVGFITSVVSCVIADHWVSAVELNELNPNDKKKDLPATPSFSKSHKFGVTASPVESSSERSTTSDGYKSTSSDNGYHSEPPALKKTLPTQDKGYYTDSSTLFHHQNAKRQVSSSGQVPRENPVPGVNQG